MKVYECRGTVLQPGINLLEKAEDFPKKGPLPIITDEYYDHLRVKREHAPLMPERQMTPVRHERCVARCCG